MNDHEGKESGDVVRVSTAEQDTDMQETELRQYVESRGREYVVYRDKAQSGANNDRPALLLTIGEECRSLSVDLVSLRQNIDTTLPAGRLTFQILGAVAEFERELLRERVKAGMAQARRTGKHVGRPVLRKFQPTEIERIRRLRSKGTSVRGNWRRILRQRNGW